MKLYVKDSLAYLSKLQFVLLRKALWEAQADPSKVFRQAYWVQSALRPTARVAGAVAKMLDIPGNLTEIDLPYNASEVRLPNLQEGDSIYGYFSLSYLGGEYAKSEFSGMYIGESR